MADSGVANTAASRKPAKMIKPPARSIMKMLIAPKTNRPSTANKSKSHLLGGAKLPAFGRFKSWSTLTEVGSEPPTSVCGSSDLNQATSRSCGSLPSHLSICSSASSLPMP